jgi:hypothetical protein
MGHMNWKASLIVVAALAWPASAAEITVLGLKLGAPLTLPRCANRDTKPCISSSDLAYRNAKQGEKVVHVDNVNPPFAKYDPEVRLLAGKIEAVGIYTQGVSTQQAAYDALVEKFGNPLSVEQIPVQNAFGAQYKIIEATWQTVDVSVEFRGATDTLTMGWIFVQTPKYSSAPALPTKPTPKL